MSKTSSPTRALSFEGKVTIVGCIYLAAVLTYQNLRFYGVPGGLPPYLYVSIIFLLPVFLLAAIGVWKKPKAGFITSIVMCALALLGVGTTLSIAQSPSVESLLAGGAIVDGAFFVTLFFSLFGARGAWGKSPPAGVRAFRLGRKAGLGALIFLSVFVAAGAVLGTTQSSVANTGQADIIIAPGSGYLTSHQFYLPQTFQAKVGQSVTWKNLDNVPHTVTSNSGLFASGSLSAGGVYSYTFKQAGTYYYTCDYHSWMVGSIMVVSG